MTLISAVGGDTLPDICNFCGSGPGGQRFLVHSPVGGAAICNFCAHFVWLQVSQYEFLRSVPLEIVN